MRLGAMISGQIWKLRFAVSFPRETWLAWSYARQRNRSIPAQVCRYGVALSLESPVLSDTVRDKILGGRYEFAEAAIARRLVRPGDRVVELGGGMGFLAAVMSAQVGSSGHVTSYEPDPAVAELAAGNLRLNGCRNVQLIQAAVTAVSSSASAQLSQEADFWIRAITSDPEGTVVSASTRTTVPTVAIADALERARPTVVVMDVEGLEHELLTHAPLPASVRTVILELHAERLTRVERARTLTALRSQGFRVVYHFQREFGFRRVEIS